MAAWEGHAGKGGTRFEGQSAAARDRAGEGEAAADVQGRGMLAIVFFGICLHTCVWHFVVVSLMHPAHMDCHARNIAVNACLARR